MNDLSTFGGRLRNARNEQGLSAKHLVSTLNRHCEHHHLKAIDLNTYYSWEKYGTIKEVISGRSNPHPSIYPVICNRLGITMYWLFYGDYGGRVKRYRAEVPGEAGLGAPFEEQLYAADPEERIDLDIKNEIANLLHLMGNGEKVAYLAYLRAQVSARKQGKY